MIRFTEGFDHYDTFDAMRKWTQTIGGMGISFGFPSRTGPGAMILGSVAQTIEHSLTKTLDDQATWIMGFGFQTEDFGITAKTIFRAIDNDTTQITMGITTGGSLFVTRGESTVLATESGVSLDVFILPRPNPDTGGQGWNYIEIKFTIDSLVGAIDVRVNEISVISIAGVNTQMSANATADSLQLANSGNAVGEENHFHFFDDIYICDTQGSIRNNFLGNCKIESRMPNGNGANSDWLNRDGNHTDNYTFVNEPMLPGFFSPDDDSSWNEALTTDDRDDYTFDTVTPAFKILSVSINAQSLSRGVGNTRKLDFYHRVDGVNYDASDSPLPGGELGQMIHEDWANSQHIWELSPEDGEDWEAADINNNTFGIALFTEGTE